MEDCTALTVIEQPALPAELLEPLRLAADFARASRAASTLAAYRSDMKVFTNWCLERGLAPMPPTPESLCAFIASEAERGRRPSTIARRLAALKWAIEGAGVLGDTERCPTDDKRVSAVLAGIRRTLGMKPVRKAPVTPAAAIAMTANATTLRELRDRALVLVGLGSAMRRSELVALECRDIEWRDDGIILTIRESKGDRFKEGQQVGVMKGSVACPVAALRAWLDAAGIAEGAIFRRVINRRHQRVVEARLAPRVVAAVVKAGVGKLGLDARDYAGHSLRRGHVSAAVRNGVNAVKIAEQTRHKSLDLIITYTKTEQLLSSDNSSAGLL